MVHHFRALNPVSQPVCSVCVANFNGLATLAACLDSVQQQEGQLAVEIIVHDDASTDDSVAYLRQHYPNVELLISEENCGFCVSNNRMVAIARGEFILLLNNDAVLHTDALRTLYEHAQQSARAGILGLPQYAAQTGELIDRGSFFDPFLNPFPNLENRCQPVGMVIGACLWIPRWLWVELGGFPEWFHTLAEDLFICCYARLRGYSVEVLANSGFRHWVGQSLGGGKVTGQRLRTTFSRRALSERNKTFVMILCYPVPWIWLLLPLHLLLLTLEGFLLSLIKRDRQLWERIYGYCLTEIWQQRRFLWAKRQAIQATQRVSARTFFAPHRWLPHKLKMWFKYGVPEVK